MLTKGNIGILSSQRSWSFKYFEMYLLIVKPNFVVFSEMSKSNHMATALVLVVHLHFEGNSQVRATSQHSRVESGVPQFMISFFVECKKKGKAGTFPGLWMNMTFEDMILFCSFVNVLMPPRCVAVVQSVTLLVVSDQCHQWLCPFMTVKWKWCIVSTKSCQRPD